MKTTTTQFTVTGTAGGRNGKRFGVWDRYNGRVCSWHKTFTAAQKEAKKRNAKAKEQ